LDNDEAPKDVVLLHGATEDGEGIRVVRARTGRELEAGEVRSAREGQPLTGELVRLQPRKGTPWLCDVETLYDAKESAQTETSPKAASGPAQVATREYRTSWDRIFGPRRKGAPN
jgi:hypothetical protein